MNNQRASGPVYLAVAALAIAALGGWALYREGRDFAFPPGTSEISMVAQSIGTMPDPGLSTLNLRPLLSRCALALTATKALELRFTPAETLEAMPAYCRETADAALAAFPADSQAYALKAIAAALEEDWPGMNDALVRSQLTGATESWIAQLRAPLALDHYDRLDAAAREALDADLLLLIVSIPGAPLVGERYIVDPAFRPRIEALVQTASPEVQRRFLSIVRREVS